MRPAWGYNYNTGAWDFYDKSPEEMEEMKKENERRRIESEKTAIVLMIILGFAGIIIINYMTAWQSNLLLKFFMFICLASLVIGLLRLILQNQLFLNNDNQFFSINFPNPATVGHIVSTIFLCY